MIATMPIRKSKNPQAVSRVLDGTTRDFDWSKDVLTLNELSYKIHPEEGYIVLAAERHPGPITRISELLQAGINKGKKFNFESFIEIQQDVTDVVARKLMPYIENMSQQVKYTFDEQE